MEEKQKKSRKWLIVLLIVLLLVIIAVSVAYACIKLKGKDNEEQAATPTETATYNPIGQEAGVITSEDDISNAMQSREPSSFTTDYKREIVVKDGTQATCYIGNSDKNYYENMYFQLFLLNEDGSVGDELYLSGTIPRGSRIESMELKKSLEPGTYSGVLSFVVVNDDYEVVSSTNFAVDIISE